MSKETNDKPVTQTPTQVAREQGRQSMSPLERFRDELEEDMDAAMNAALEEGLNKWYAEGISQC